MKSSIFTKKEFLLIIILGLILGMRQIAVGIVTPFVASYTESLAFGTIALGGIALGITSLSKGIFQVPFGNLGDRIGNRKVIFIGMSLLLGGLLIIIFSNNAYMFMIGRAFQGTGAIVGAGYALLSNLIEGDKRVDAISLVSVIVGLFNAASLGLGPVLRDFMSIKEMYILSAILVFLAIILILFLKDDNREEKIKIEVEEVIEEVNKKQYVISLLKNKDFLGFLVISFMTYFVGVAGFFVIPQYLDKLIGQDKMWTIFTPAILLSIVVMKKSSKYLNRGYTRLITILAGASMLLAVILLLDAKSLILVGIATFLIFTGFNVLSTVLPVGANKIATSNVRGLVNGIVNTFSFVGNFAGAAILGMLWVEYRSLAFILLGIGSILIIIMAMFCIKRK